MHWRKLEGGRGVEEEGNDDGGEEEADMDGMVNEEEDRVGGGDVVSD